MLSHYETHRIKSKLLEFPSLIQTQKQKIRVLRDAFKDADTERGIIEADLASQINAEMDPNSGKQKFSNQATRDAELMKRKVANAGYVAADKKARQARYAMNEAEDELEALQDKYRSYRYVARLVSAELEFMAGMSGDMAAEESGEEAAVQSGGVNGGNELY
jgi:hypothetical protein